MPFVCAMERGEPRLYPGPETNYKIYGRRDEQPFIACAPDVVGRCETMMVHRFAVECDGVRLPWARVAAAGRSAGVTLPSHMPNGFAPVSTLAGRIVLPSQMRGGGGVMRVAMQDLSPDSVMDAPDLPVERKNSDWTTTVRADAAPDAGGGAFQVAIWVTALIIAMLATSLVAAGRWRLPQFAFEGFADTFGAARHNAFGFARDAYGAIDERVRDATSSWFSDDDDPGDHALFNATLMIHAKLAEGELALAALPPDLLLREVLRTEIEQVRQRAADADRRVRSRTREKSAAIYRTLHRELDRILRIAQGASVASQREAQDAYDAPQSQSEAYRVLGLNSDAPPAAAKKLIDALRMTWHPDHARDEPDRLRREARMKQINAAWDMVRETRKAA